MAGDLHRYFVEIPGASDEWWRLLVDGIHDLWGERSLVHSGLPPVHRLVGWLVEQDRRADAESVVRWLAHPRRTRTRGTATTSSSRPTCWTCRASTPPPWPCATTSGQRPRWLRKDEVLSRNRATHASTSPGLVTGASAPSSTNGDV